MFVPDHTPLGLLAHILHAKVNVIILIKILKQYKWHYPAKVTITQHSLFEARKEEETMHKQWKEDTTTQLQNSTQNNKGMKQKLAFNRSAETTALMLKLVLECVLSTMVSVVGCIVWFGLFLDIFWTVYARLIARSHLSQLDHDRTDLFSVFTLFCISKRSLVRNVCSINNC